MTMVMEKKPHEMNLMEEETRWLKMFKLVDNFSPYWAFILKSMNREPNFNIATLGVFLTKGHNRVTLAYNPDFFWNKLPSDKARQLILSHELMHYLFRHFSRKRALEMRLKSKNRPILLDVLKNTNIFNVAADFAINSLLLPDIVDPKVMGEGHTGIFPGMKDLPNGRSAEWYFYELVDDEAFQQKQEVPKEVVRIVIMKRGDNSDTEREDRDQKQSKDKGNSQEARTAPPNSGDESEMGECRDLSQEDGDVQEISQEPEELSQEDEEAIEDVLGRMAEDALREESKRPTAQHSDNSFGKAILNVERLVKAGVKKYKPRQRSEKKLLRLKTAKLIRKQIVPETTRSWKRLSRYSMNGVSLPGRNKDISCKRVAVLIDASGSMDAKVSALGMQVLFGLLRHYTYNVELIGIVFSGDARTFMRAKSVSGRRLIRGVEEVPYIGGGTCVTSAFDEAIKYNPDVIVVWTDGDFPTREMPQVPSTKKGLWYFTTIGLNNVRKEIEERGNRLTPWAKTSVVGVEDFVREALESTIKIYDPDRDIGSNVPESALEIPK